MKKILYLIFLGCTCLFQVNAQDDTDLLSMLGEEETIDYTSAAFKTNRVINLHSLENTARGVLDFKISHRFGFINGGAYEFFGLDNATIRLGLDYGITNNFQIGIGRSGFEKTFDGYMKYRLLRQSTGKRRMPITLSILAASAIRGQKWTRDEVEYPFFARFNYTYQLILGRKFSDNFSLQLSPTVVHRNLVLTRTEMNDVFALGIAMRQRITRRLALNVEYIYVLPDQIAPGLKHSLSIGCDIETGGHVFQLHFTNSTAMNEKGFIAETTGDWLKGGIRFGFNVSRVFTIVKPKLED
ncbi:MAG: hypothetical protein IPI60_04540 [Saprospiraceae bacterium]|nr:hypothetical protein [Saprospiraceae bacterium]